MTQWDIKLKPVPFVMTTGGSDLQQTCNCGLLAFIN